MTLWQSIAAGLVIWLGCSVIFAVLWSRLPRGDEFDDAPSQDDFAYYEDWADALREWRRDNDQ